MKLHDTTAVACAAMLSLAGCQSIHVWSFDTQPGSSAVEQGRVELINLSTGTGPSFDNLSTGEVKTNFPGIDQTIGADCVNSKKGLIALSFAPVIGKLIFDFTLDKLARDMESLKKSATKSYSARYSFNGDDIKRLAANEQCLALVRYPVDKTLPDSIVIVKLRLHDGTIPSVSFRPVFVQVRRSVATTRAAADPKVTVSIAMAIKTVGIKQDIGLPLLSSTGEAVMSVPGTLIAPASKPKCLGEGTNPRSYPCEASEPVPFIAGTGASVLSFGVTEAGFTGLDFDVAAAELKAIKEAVGPAVSEYLKARAD